MLWNDNKVSFQFYLSKHERCSSWLVMLIMWVQENQGKGNISRQGYTLIVGWNIKAKSYVKTRFANKKIMF